MYDTEKEGKARRLLDWYLLPVIPRILEASHSFNACCAVFGQVEGQGVTPVRA